MLFILAQICGTIALVLTVISVHFKTKEKMDICSIIANIVVAIQFFLLNAITGGIISIINTIRGLVYYYYKKKDKKPSLLILLSFEIIAIISGIITWQNIWSIIPITATCIYTYALWQDNVTFIRFATGLVGLEWAIYDLMVRAYVGVVQETSQFISAVISLIRNRKAKYQS